MSERNFSYPFSLYQCLLEGKNSVINEYFRIIHCIKKSNIRNYDKDDLSALAKEQGYYKLHKGRLFLFILRITNNNHKRMSVHPVKIMWHQQEIDKFEEQEMAKSAPVVKSKQSEWYD